MAHSTTFAGLTQYIKDYCDHDGDTEFATMIDGIIARGQDRLQIALNLEMFRSYPTKTITASTSTVDISGDDYLAITDVYVTSNSKFLERMSNAFVTMYGGTGEPEYYSRESEGTLKFAPTPASDTGITLEVQAREPVLNGSNTTNWFTKHAAHALELSCLIEAERFLQAPERKAEFERDFIAAVQQIRQEQPSHSQRESYARNVGAPSQPTELAR